VVSIFANGFLLMTDMLINKAIPRPAQPGYYQKEFNYSKPLKVGRSMIA